MYIIFGWIVCRASYTTFNLFAHHAYPVTLKKLSHGSPHTHRKIDNDIHERH